MQVPDYSAFTKAVAEDGAQPEAAFAALWQLTREVVGVKLFTVMTHDGRKGVASRIFSNMPDAYPVSGTKPPTSPTGRGRSSRRSRPSSPTTSRASRRSSTTMS